MYNALLKNPLSMPLVNRDVLRARDVSGGSWTAASGEIGKKNMVKTNHTEIREALASE